MSPLCKRSSALQESAVPSEHLLGTVPGDLLERGVDVDDGVVRLERVGDDEPARAGVEHGPDGEGAWPPVVEQERVLLLLFVLLLLLAVGASGRRRALVQIHGRRPESGRVVMGFHSGRGLGRRMGGGFYWDGKGLGFAGSRGRD